MFRVDTQNGHKFVLRIYSNEETTIQDNMVEMYWLNALKKDTNLFVSEPVRNRVGEYITTVEIEGVPGEKRCALFCWVPGRPLEEHLSPGNYYKLGQTMAALHDHAETLSTPSELRPKRWDKVFYYPDEPVIYNTPAYRHLFPPERQALMDRFVERAHVFLKRLFKSEKEPIWIHGDLHYWNVHYFKGDLYTIDFEDVMQGYPLQDVAITLWYGRQREDYADLRAAFVEGYSSMRDWPVSAPGQLEILMAARSANFINYVARIDPDPEEYIATRCQELEQYLDNFPE
ncbi:phosphotransferase enzyme family protein [Chloroflexota bacterium]